MVEIVGNRSDFVEIRSENRWTGQQTNSVRRAVRWVEPGIFCGIFYRLGSTRLNGSNMARVWLSRRLPRGAWDARGKTVSNIQEACVAHPGVQLSWCLRQWVRMDELYTGEWSKLVFDNFENSAISKNTSVFWRTGLRYQLLVGETTCGGFETLGGDKTHCFISRTKAYKHKKLNTRPLSFSLVFLSNLSTQFNRSWALYLYTKSKYKNSNFPSVKAAGGCGWWLAVAAGRWVVAFLDLLDWV